MAVERINIAERDDWLAMRHANINASEVATVLGLGAYGSLAELYAEKKGLRPPKLDAPLLRRGRWLEAAVFEALADERPHWDVKRARIYLLDRERRLGATPDGYALLPTEAVSAERVRVVQAKVISRSVFKRRWLANPDDDISTGEAEAPIYYQLQTLTEMMLWGKAHGLLAVLVTGEFDAVLRLFPVERDEHYEAMILDGVAKFQRDHLDAGVMPDFVPQIDAALIKALYPQADGSVIDLSSANHLPMLVDQLTELRAASTRITKETDTVKAELQALLREHTYGKLADGRVIQAKNEFRKAHHVKASNPRVLRVLKQMPHLGGADDIEEDAA